MLFSVLLVEEQVFWHSNVYVNGHL